MEQPYVAVIVTVYVPMYYASFVKDHEAPLAVFGLMKALRLGTRAKSALTVLVYTIAPQVAYVWVKGSTFC